METDDDRIELLTQLPIDALQAVARQLVCQRTDSRASCAVLSVRAVQRFSATCAAARSAALTDGELWALLTASRYTHSYQMTPELVEELRSRVTGGPGSRERWCSLRREAQEVLCGLPRLTPAAEAPCCSGGVASGAPVAMSANPVTRDALEIEQFERAVEAVQRELWETRPGPTPTDVLEWLLGAPPGGTDALTLLAVVFTLRMCLQQTDERDALAGELRQLGPLPDSFLAQRLEVKSYTWSQLRDCRGFRARDDVRMRHASLRELAFDDRHEIWDVLARGVRYEVQRVTIRAVR